MDIITSGVLDKYLSEIGSKNNSLDDLIRIHECLCDKICSNRKCDITFISKLLYMGYSLNYPYSYTEGASEFIKSKYLSNYFKEEIKKVIKDRLSDEMLISLEEDKLINDMTEAKIKEMMVAINDYYRDRDGTDKSELLRLFEEYLYKLDGRGVVLYLKNNMHPRRLAYHILESNGISCEAGCYSGRGVKLNDLNHEHLIAIFNKLYILDINYALEFVKMVDSMEMLGASEFIELFYRFVGNGFKYIDVVAITDDSKYGLLVSSKNRNKNEQGRNTIYIKSRFMQSIDSRINIIAPNFITELRETKKSDLKRTK